MVKIIRMLRVLILKNVRSNYLYILYGAVFFGYMFRIRLHILSRSNFFIKRDSGGYIEGEFRRNIHRLEKGLITVPRKPVFGLDYIDWTVSTFLANSNDLDDSLFNWSQNVLNEYFNTVEHNSLVELASKFRSQTKNSQNATVFYNKLEDPVIADLEWSKLLRKRRSVREYDNVKIDELTLKNVLTEAFMSPSACNRLSFRYMFFHEPSEIQTIASIPGGARSWMGNISNLGCLIGDMSPYPEVKDRNTVFIDGGLSLMQMLLSLQVRGISSCVINFPDVKNMQDLAAKQLNLSSSEFVIALFAFGLAKQDIKVTSSGKL